MEGKKYLTEENYNKGKKKIKTIAIIILISGFLIGGGLIAFGLSRNSSTRIDKLTQNLEQEKQKIVKQKIELEEKIKPIQDEITSLERVHFTGFDDAYYAREDRIAELAKSIKTDKKAISTIEEVTEDGNDCDTFEESYSYTANYCSLANKLYAAKDGFDSMPFYVFGAFIIIVSCMVALPIYITSKGREIAAFSAQQMMPIAQEGIEKMAPTVTKVGKEVLKEMAPAYGEVAKDISKGIKEGIKDEKK